MTREGEGVGACLRGISYRGLVIFTFGEERFADDRVRTRLDGKRHTVHYSAADKYFSPSCFFLERENGECCRGMLVLALRSGPRGEDQEIPSSSASSFICSRSFPYTGAHHLRYFFSYFFCSRLLIHWSLPNAQGGSQLRLAFFPVLVYQRQSLAVRTLASRGLAACWP